MTEEQKKALKIYAENWLTRTHIGRTYEERQAFIDGVEEALTAVFENTRHGLYPANTLRQEIEEIFEGE